MNPFKDNPPPFKVHNPDAKRLTESEEALESLRALDCRNDITFTSWENDFADNLLTENPKFLSPKQIEVIRNMEEKYG
jgi:hypothetical protein